jgi:hypothetical protein
MKWPLFKMLYLSGIRNTISLFSAVLTDYKILFLSQSYSRLTDACHGLTALMYPLRYSYVYIPILPSSLVEVLNTPTPFLAGVHSSLRDEVFDLVGHVSIFCFILSLNNVVFHSNEIRVVILENCQNHMWQMESTYSTTDFCRWHLLQTTSTVLACIFSNIIKLSMGKYLEKSCP